VTAVLLGYRAIDTLLEKIVMLLAVVGVWALARGDDWGRALASLADPADDGTLALLARGMAPVGVVFAVYMVWTGADHPGGTFQGGAILAGLWLVAAMAGLLPLPRSDDRRLRLALAAGPAAFLAAGFAGSVLAGAFLAYPPGLAKPIIVTVEIVLTVTVAAVVVLLVAGPPSEQRR
jgi:multisubunit Na+/H+ antiporter MnhB subunit